MSFSTCWSERPRRFSAQKLGNSSGPEALQRVSSSEAPELRYEVSFCRSLLWFRFILVCSLFSQSAGCLCISGLTLLLSLSPPLQDASSAASSVWAECPTPRWWPPSSASQAWRCSAAAATWRWPAPWPCWRTTSPGSPPTTPPSPWCKLLPLHYSLSNTALKNMMESERSPMSSQFVGKDESLMSSRHH